ncbi:hypothetical protein QYH69_13310 [Paraburkholderia sp. SARCC-3016]|jgi:hypothetical protein|uniref:hypothetical protein n=1 Tax=Paraburkholderia sp. SARCC-3016 TaxID=3058611 RepID=UPI002808620C|nr:hypothetical protein [Paraburkholderia sp. SARCC-3016]MDQ7978223.1 hypothetical protein [Paraburkholderia sp. SARCC-3016]
MEKMITQCSADIPASWRAAVRPTLVCTISRSTSTATELFGLQRDVASPETHTVDSARSTRLAATWGRTVDGTLVCRWVSSVETQLSCAEQE